MVDIDKQVSYFGRGSQSLYETGRGDVPVVDKSVVKGVKNYLRALQDQGLIINSEIARREGQPITITEDL